MIVDKKSFNNLSFVLLKILAKARKIRFKIRRSQVISSILVLSLFNKYGKRVLLVREKNYFYSFNFIMKLVDFTFIHKEFNLESWMHI